MFFCIFKIVYPVNSRITVYLIETHLIIVILVTSGRYQLHLFQVLKDDRGFF